MNERKKRSRILIVDDSQLSRMFLSGVLEQNYDIIEAEDGIGAVDILSNQSESIDLVLLDLVMPNMDGFEVLKTMGHHNWIEHIPVIMISSENSDDYIKEAYRLGVTDYISRPFDDAVVNRRVANTLMLYAQPKNLINMVSEMFLEREKSNSMMIDILSHIVEFKNGESGRHVQNIHIITELLLKQLKLKSEKFNLSQPEIELISLVSALHDIGKIGIPGEILNKPGKLTDEEFETIKNHTVIGASMLMSLDMYKDEPLIKTAYEVCRWHHERYDGKGYPDGLAGDDIPISAQIVSIADVYDALTNERCYKKAFSHETAVSMICNGECGAFQPIIIECLREIGDQLKENLGKPLTELQSFDNLYSILELLERTGGFAGNIPTHSDNAKNDAPTTRIEPEDEFDESESDDILSLTGVEFSDLMCNLKKIFRTVRLIDVRECLCIELDENGVLTETPHHCYDIWERNGRCENCISGTAYRKKRQMTKIEFFDSEIYCVIANYVVVDDVPCVLEVAFKTNDDILLADSKTDVNFTQFNLKEYSKRLYTDVLTNAHNRRFYNEKISGIKKAEGVAMIDVDDFKHINDTYGHGAGDIVLKKIVEVIQSGIRETDFVVRYGGDEFLLIFPTIPEEVFKSKLEHIRNSVSNLRFESYPNIKITVSIGGVYDYYPLSEAVKCADNLMYGIKQEGKNAVNFSK